MTEILLPELKTGSNKFVWTNPSITRHPKYDYLCAVRLTSSPLSGGNTSVVTVGQIDLHGVPKFIKQIKPIDNDRRFDENAYVMHHGAHDLRLFTVGEQLFGTATIWDNTVECVQPDGSTQARIGLIQISDEFTWVKTVVLPSLFGAVEKNWMPVEGELSWLYFPPRNIFCTYDRDKKTAQFKKIGSTSPGLAYARGGTQLIDVGNNRLLGVVHEVAPPVVHENIPVYRLQYLHKFVLYDRDTKNLLAVSPQFYFISGNCVEFAAGITLTPDRDRVVVSFGYRDLSAWLAAARLDDILSAMIFLPEPS